MYCVVIWKTKQVNHQANQHSRFGKPTTLYNPVNLHLMNKWIWNFTINCLSGLIFSTVLPGLETSNRLGLRVHYLAFVVGEISCNLQTNTSYRIKSSLYWKIVTVVDIRRSISRVRRLRKLKIAGSITIQLWNKYKYLF